MRVETVVSKKNTNYNSKQLPSCSMLILAWVDIKCFDGCKLWLNIMSTDVKKRGEKYPKGHSILWVEIKLTTQWGKPISTNNNNTLNTTHKT